MYFIDVLDTVGCIFLFKVRQFYVRDIDVVPAFIRGDEVVFKMPVKLLKLRKRDPRQLRNSAKRFARSQINFRDRVSTCAVEKVLVFTL